MRKTISGAKLALALGLFASNALAYNLDGNKALLEPAQTIAEGNKVIDAEKSKCPYEFFTKDTALAYFHLKKGEVLNGVKVPDDRTLVQGSVCQESVYSLPLRLEMKAQKALGMQGFLGFVLLVGLLGGAFMVVAWVMVTVKANHEIQFPDDAGCAKCDHKHAGFSCSCGCFAIYDGGPFIA